MYSVNSYFKKLLLLGLMSYLSLSAVAQEATDIWLAKLKLNAKVPVSDIFQITNNASYSDQPYFFSNDLLFYSQGLDIDQDKQQVDTFVFDFKLGMAKNLTQSSTSEYSPRPLPYQNGLSVILVNAENKQQLWALNPQGKPQTHLVPVIEPVGYQVWINQHELLLFVLGEPNTLQRVDINQPKRLGIKIDSNIGPSLKQYKDSPWFLYTRENEGNYLHAVDIQSNKSVQMFKLPDNITYFTLTPSGVLIASDGARIWKRKILLSGAAPNALEEFSQLKIAGKACVTGVGRIAVSPDESMIALVCNRQVLEEKSTEQKEKSAEQDQ